jgi:2-hydroxychromene-2-carboxylate isomerase
MGHWLRVRRARRSVAGAKAVANVKVDFYFDFISPFGYLARHGLQRLVARHPGTIIEYHPVDLPRVKLAAGNTGPTNREIPPKIKYLTSDLARWANLYGIPMVAVLPGPRTAEVNRGLYYASDRGVADAYVRTVWQGIWGEGIDPGTPAFLDVIANRMAWSATEFASYVDGTEALERFESSNLAAIQRGIFGVPIMMVGDEMWWGNDRIDFLERYVSAL